MIVRQLAPLIKWQASWNFNAFIEDHSTISLIRHLITILCSRFDISVSLLQLS